MAVREWTMDTPAMPVIRLEHGYFSGRAALYIDNELVFERPRTIFDWGFNHEFCVAETPCFVRVCPTWFGTFRYEFRANEPLPGPMTTAGKVKRFSLVLLGILLLYVGSYCCLSASGGYYWGQTGRLRYRSGFSVSDIVIWHPRFLFWQPFVNVRGEKTTRGNTLGYIYSPLITIDRRFIHPTDQFLDPEQFSDPPAD